LLAHEDKGKRRGKEGGEIKKKNSPRAGRCVWAQRGKEKRRGGEKQVPRPLLGIKEKGGKKGENPQQGLSVDPFFVDNKRKKKEKRGSLPVYHQPNCRRSGEKKKEKKREGKLPVSFKEIRLGKGKRKEKGRKGRDAYPAQKGKKKGKRRGDLSHP